MSGRVDLVVVGGGPAGMACAATAAGLGLRVVLVEQSALGGELNTVSWVDSPSGDPVTGPDLAARMMDELLDSGAEVSYDTVSGIERSDGGWQVSTAAGDSLRTDHLVLATGVEVALDALPGAERAHGHGLSLCASCDAPLFAGKAVAVIGNGRDAAAQARDLVPYAASVTMILEDGDSTPAVPGVESVRVRRVLDVVGVPVQSVVVETSGGEPVRIDVQGVFLGGPRRPRRELLDHLGSSGSDEDVIVIGDLRPDSERTVVAAVAEATAAARRIHARTVTGGVPA